MGSGRWSTDVYDAATRMRAATGASAFVHTDSGAREGARRAQPVRAWTCGRAATATSTRSHWRSRCSST